ncbi:Carboxypeptidase B [Halotydeus destructor]|nr:Carboxypeptidase B [Halotydeus destructor]
MLKPFICLFVFLSTVLCTVHDEFEDIDMFEVDNLSVPRAYIGSLNAHDIPIWRQQVLPTEPFRILVSFAKLNIFYKLTTSFNLTANLVSRFNDIVLSDKVVDQVDGYSVNSYMTWNQQENFLQQFAANLSNVIVSSIGVTEHNRTLPVVEFGSEKAEVIILACGLDPSQWLSHASCFGFMQNLVTLESDLFRKYNVLVFPNMNPDGYVQAWTHDRLWTKNMRNITNNNSCEAVGVHLDSNFPIYWPSNSTRLGESVCSPQYKGSNASSEPEVRHFLNYVQDNVIDKGKRIIAYFNIQANGQKLLWPPSFLGDSHQSIENISAVSTEFNSGSRTNVSVRYSSSGLWKYENHASHSVDYFNQALNVTLSLVIKLRPKMASSCTNKIGLFYPENKIHEVVEDLYSGIESLLRSRETGSDGNPFVTNETLVTKSSFETTTSSPEMVSLVSTISLAAIVLAALFMLAWAFWRDIYEDVSDRDRSGHINYSPLDEDLSASQLAIDLDAMDYSDLIEEPETGHRSQYEHVSTKTGLLNDANSTDEARSVVSETGGGSSDDMIKVMYRDDEQENEFS